MANFVTDRIRSIIFYPAYEWKIIAAEKRSLYSDFSGYAIPLIFYGALAKGVGSFFFVRNVLDIDAYRFSFPLVQMLIFLFMQIIIVITMTYFVYGLAGKLKSEKDFQKSGKLIIYALTPYFLSYIVANLNRHMSLALIPAVYAIILLAKGLNPVLKTDKQKIPSFIFILLLCFFGISYLLEFGFSFLTTWLFPDIVLQGG